MAWPPRKVSGLFYVHAEEFMRYQARWSNGYWKTFDTIRFEDAAIHYLKREAEESAGKMNARQK